MELRGQRIIERSHASPAILECGDQAAAQPLPLVYEELRRLAAHELCSEPIGQTLRSAALVREAYVTSVGQDDEPK